MRIEILLSQMCKFVQMFAKSETLNKDCNDMSLFVYFFKFLYILYM